MSEPTMTLAFELDAVERLDDPRAAFEDARRWSTHVGVVSDRMAYQVVNALRDNGIFGEDFFSRADTWKSLAAVGDRTRTDRHVFVGASPEDAHLAEEVGWEFVTLEAAADKAGWSVRAEAVDQSRPSFGDRNNTPCH